MLIHCSSNLDPMQCSDKPGKIDFSEKSQGNSGKLEENMDFWKKIRENLGNFFNGELFL